MAKREGLPLGCMFAVIAAAVLLVLLGLLIAAAFVTARRAVREFTQGPPAGSGWTGSQSKGTSHPKNPIPETPDGLVMTETFTKGLGLSGAARLIGVKTRVKIRHSRPADLQVTLVHPDGTKVLLHRGAPGRPGEPSGIDGTYPTTLEPAESLDVLKNRPAVGTWKLMVNDGKKGRTGDLLEWNLELDFRY